MGEEECVKANKLNQLNHFIFPIKNFSLEALKTKFVHILDEDKNISLRAFDYEKDIEPVNSDQFSTLDLAYLKKDYHWGFRFDCIETAKLKYLELCNLLLMAFRIFNLSDCNGIYLLNVNNPHLSVKEDNQWKNAVANKHNSTYINFEELKKLKMGYEHLKSFYFTSPRTKHSVQFLYLGYISNYWMQAYILFMTALETLISPPTEEQITIKIIKRTRSLIGNSKICSKAKLEKLYELRSNIIHGRITVSLDFNEHIEEIVKLQTIVLSAFKIILSKNYISIYKNEETKEQFFLDLENNVNKK